PPLFTPLPRLRVLLALPTRRSSDLGNVVAGPIGGPVTKLPHIVPAPFPNRAVRTERRRVPVSAGNGHDVAQRRNLHRVRPVDGGAVPQFTDSVEPPCPDGVI